MPINTRAPVRTYVHWIHIRTHKTDAEGLFIRFSVQIVFSFVFYVCVVPCRVFYYYYTHTLSEYGAAVTSNFWHSVLLSPSPTFENTPSQSVCSLVFLSNTFGPKNTHALGITIKNAIRKTDKSKIILNAFKPRKIERESYIYCHSTATACIPTSSDMLLLFDIIFEYQKP